MSNEYISRESVLADIEQTIEDSGCVNHEREIIDCVRYADAADVVQVVRCKDCCKRSTDQCPMYEDSEELTHDWTQDDWYCSLGVRVDGGENHG